jgi:hypothetical protein
VVITVTTVGYGDIAPTTPPGRLVAALLAYAGILSIAMPVTIIGNNFSKQYTKLYEERGGRFEMDEEAGQKGTGEGFLTATVFLGVLPTLSPLSTNVPS